MANQALIKDKKVTVGDLVSVSVVLKEKGKTRLFPFEGVVIAIRGEGENKSFVVRKIALGKIGVERIWPVNSPWIEKIEVKKPGQARRAKLYYLRSRQGKSALKIKKAVVKKKSSKK